MAKLGHVPGVSPAPSAHHALGWAGPIFCADANILTSSHTCTAYCPIRRGWGACGWRARLSRPSLPWGKRQQAPLAGEAALAPQAEAPGAQHRPLLLL